jgi:hypothetical protein
MTPRMTFMRSPDLPFLIATRISLELMVAGTRLRRQAMTNIVLSPELSAQRTAAQAPSQLRALLSHAAPLGQSSNFFIHGVLLTDEDRAIGTEYNNLPGIAIEMRPSEARQCERKSLELNGPSTTSTFLQNRTLNPDV